MIDKKFVKIIKNYSVEVIFDALEMSRRDRFNGKIYLTAIRSNSEMHGSMLQIAVRARSSDYTAKWSRGRKKSPRDQLQWMFYRMLSLE